jgi:histo-blood group ABO system transferase
MRIGLLVIATQPAYAAYAADLLRTADTHFFTSSNDEVSYFVFTDTAISYTGPRQLIVTRVEHKPWPHMTLGRYAIFCTHADVFANMDYVYYADADTYFVAAVGREIALPQQLVVVRHPSYRGTRGTPETRRLSTACIRANERMPAYVCGGFNGGPRAMYLAMARTLRHNIDTDAARGITAVWHDESHLNRYLVDHARHMMVLPSSYCHAYNADVQPKLVAVVKNCGARD